MATAVERTTRHTVLFRNNGGGLWVLHDPEALLRPAEEWVASAPTG